MCKGRLLEICNAASCIEGVYSGFTTRSIVQRASNQDPDSFTKMADKTNPCKQVKCYKCKKTKDKKDSLTCFNCKNSCDFSCAKIPEKLVRLMEIGKKQKWKCESCNIIEQKVPHSASSIVTTRRGKGQDLTIKDLLMQPNRARSLSEESKAYESLTSTSSETNMRSLDLSTVPDMSLIVELREEITSLKINLESAKLEIENLVLENGELQGKLLNSRNN